jgi:hypothetical protein
MESGLVLFSTRHVCVDGERVDPEEALQYLRSGSSVQFIDKTFESKEYSVLSSGDQTKLFKNDLLIKFSCESTKHMYLAAIFLIISFLDCILRQAVGVWIGEKPSHFLRSVLSKLHLEDLARDRREFVSRIKNNDFLALDMVRSGGKIVGYLNKDIGIISTRDTSSGTQKRLVY